MELVRPRLEVSGNYTLTITAANECRAGERPLPEEAWTRTYQAAVRLDGSRLDFTLSGATFTRGRATFMFNGKVVPEGVEAFVPLYDSPTLSERLSTGEVLLIYGSVKATGSANRITGTIEGDLAVYPTDNIFDTATAWCYSARHQIVLSR